MTLATQLTTAFQNVGADIKAILASRGSLAALTTTDKTNLVAAINEIKSSISAAAGILDTATDGDTTHTWSADKIYDELQALKTSIINGAPAAYDTLVEISTYLSSNDSTVAGLTTAIANRVSYADVQSLTTGQKLQACTNIGLGDPETDYAAIYAAAKA